MAASASSRKRVMLYGNVGVGKSTLTEKICNVENLSSDSAETMTRSARTYPASDTNLSITDAPGNNDDIDRMDHNLWIAQAMSSGPLSLIALVVKADKRIPNIIQSVKELASRFSQFSNLLCVCVTHGDEERSWTDAGVSQRIRDSLGIPKVMVVGKTTSRANLIDMFLSNCVNQPVSICITHENFLKYFDVADDNMLILNTIQEEVGNFEAMTQRVNEILANPEYAGDVGIDLLFAYQAFATNEIGRIVTRVSDKHNFSYTTNKSEYGHIANMINQLKNVLFDIRMRTYGAQKSHKMSELRRCPYCACVWEKKVGCDSQTTCGRRLYRSELTAHESRDTFSNFTFSWSRLTKVMTIQRTPWNIQQVDGEYGGQVGYGCGRDIVWSSMQVVTPSAELGITRTVDVDDIAMVEKQRERDFQVFFRDAMSQRIVL